MVLILGREAYPHLLSTYPLISTVQTIYMRGLITSSQLHRSILPRWTLRTRDIKQFAQGQWVLNLGFKCKSPFVHCIMMLVEVKGSSYGHHMTSDTWEPNVKFHEGDDEDLN